MTARVLVVDDILPNVKLLEAKLTGEYFDVMCATNGEDALKKVQKEKPDIVLLDVMMPGMDGFEVCRRIKENPETHHIPVVMVTALDQTSDRVAGLEAGADDFLTKPVQDVALFARVRSLVRLKVTMDEFRNRTATQMSIGKENGDEDIKIDPGKTNILVIEDRKNVTERISDCLEKLGKVTVMEGDENAIERARQRNDDLVIVSLDLKGVDGLRVCSMLRSYEETRQVPILALVEETDTRNLVRALDIGVNDYLVRPLDKLELTARVRTQLRRKRFADQLRENLHLSMQLAITDAVTGLYNRHYMTSHLATLFEAAQKSRKPLSLALLDIDHFKTVNDTHGHAAGDNILKEFASRISRNVRGVDLAARYGGEEFVVIMPDTSCDDAREIAERLRTKIEDQPFEVKDDGGSGETIPITVSIGIASLKNGGGPDTPSDLICDADEALYQAKNSGRNRVEVAA